MGEALKDAYADLFLIKANPTEKDRSAFEGKFKSAHNATEMLAKRMSNTFFALLALADLTSSSVAPPVTIKEEVKELPVTPVVEMKTLETSLHYNIQIHLPATKDIEVFNAIFKSLREHLID